MQTHKTKSVKSFYNRSTWIYEYIFRLPYHRGRKAVASLCLDRKSVLDLGCNQGQMRMYISSPIYVGIDLSEYSIEKAKRYYPNDTFYEGDIEVYKVNQKFDVVVLNHVISVTPSREELLSNAAYHLNPGGILIINNHFADTIFHQWIDKICNRWIFLGTKFYNPKPKRDSLKEFKFVKEFTSNLFSKCIVFEKV